METNYNVCKYPYLQIIYTYTHVCMCVHVYVCMYMYVCVWAMSISTKCTLLLIQMFLLKYFMVQKG